MLRSFTQGVETNFRIITALMMREIVTRYGRQGLGFAWLVGEPLLFVFAVILIWSLIKSPYQHGIRIAPFVMTGYMALLMFRHMISYGMSAVSGNIGLLYHQNVQILHVYISRFLMEFAGSTLAFCITYVILVCAGQVGLPSNLLLLYWGWISLFIFSAGAAMTLSALALEFDIIERLSNVLLYAILPFSGVFVMAAWLPRGYREIYLAFPMPHAIEMIRAGVFGEFVETHYDAVYPFFWGSLLFLIGLILLSRAKQHVDSD